MFSQIRASVAGLFGVVKAFPELVSVVVSAVKGENENKELRPVPLPEITLDTSLFEFEVEKS